MASSVSPAPAAKSVDLTRVGLPRLLFALLHQRFTGSMLLPAAGGAPERTVWFRGGMPVGNDWHAPEEALPRLLVDAKVVREHVIAAAEATAGTGDESAIVAVLLRAGDLTETKLREVRRQRTFRALSQLFALRDEHVSVFPQEHEMGDEAAAINVLQLIADGVMRHYDEGRIELEMGAVLNEGVIATSAFERYRAHFAFPASDAEALRALTAGTELRRLIEQHRLPKRRAHQIIYTLWACQMLKPSVAAANDAPTAPSSAAPSVPMPAAVGVTAVSRNTSPPPPPPAKPASPARSVSPAQPPSKPAAPPPATPARAAPATSPAPRNDPTFERELASYEQKIAARANAFELLGVPLTAGKKEIRRAWSDLSVSFHPDALASKGLTHLRERVNQVFAALSEAQHILSDAEQRDKLRERLERGEESSTDATAMAHAAFQGELIAKEADKLLRADRFQLALERYREAAALTPDEPDLRAAIAWCEYNVSARDKAAAFVADRKLAELLEATPNLARGHYFRGFILRDLGAVDGAIKAFEHALTIDRRLLDAERQARALRIQKGHPVAKATTKPPTVPRAKGLKGLFGRK